LGEDIETTCDVTLLISYYPLIFTSSPRYLNYTKTI